MARSKTILAAMTVLVVLAGLGNVLANEGEEHAATHEGATTVRGEVLDMACYLGHEAKGPEHAGCAKRCVKGGQPMGLLAEDGTVYLLLASHEDGSAYEKTKEHAGERVEITGVVSSQAGFKGLEVDGVKPL